MKKKIVLDYSFPCTVQSLFRAISTAEGLASWFAEKVDITGNTYTFFWNKVPVTAVMVSIKENSAVKFYWTDDPKYTFEFKIIQNELIYSNSLIITDFTDEEDEVGAVNLWNAQIEKLRRAIGCAKN